MTIIFSSWTMLYEYSSLVASFADLHLTFKLHTALPLILTIVLQQDVISYQDGENFIMSSFRSFCSHRRTVFYFFPSCSTSIRFRVIFSPYGASLLPSSILHTQKDYCVRVVSPTQRPLPENLQHSHALGGVQTRSLSKWDAAYPLVKERGHWDRCPVLLEWQY
jgi:hypothetical protein